MPPGRNAGCTILEWCLHGAAMVPSIGNADNWQ
jgi:hypothetical protein